jgi:hypothetical protein
VIAGFGIDFDNSAKVVRLIWIDHRAAWSGFGTGDGGDNAVPTATSITPAVSGRAIRERR